MDGRGVIASLPADVALHRQQDPETFLARIAIVAEGQTEVGFVRTLLEMAVGADYLAHGIWISDAKGNPHTLKLLKALTGSGLVFAGFADDEGDKAEAWADLRTRLGKLLFRWPSGCLEENIIRLVPQDCLEEFIKDPEGDSGYRLRTLAERLNIPEKDFSSIRTKAPDLTSLIIEAAITHPEDQKDADRDAKKVLKSHAREWFKSVEGGADWPARSSHFGFGLDYGGELLPFLNAVRGAVSLPEIPDLPQPMPAGMPNATITELQP